MPFYNYECASGHSTEELRRVDERNDPFPCPQCGEPGALVIGTARIDYLAMGCDSDFPTAWSKWEKLQRAKASGKMWDSNNNRYGGEYEKAK